MRLRSNSLWPYLFAALLFAAFLFAGCGDDPPEERPDDIGVADADAAADMGGTDAVSDATVDVADVSDAETQDANADADAADGGTTLPGDLCKPCSSNQQCGGPQDLCLTLLSEEQFCGMTCATQDDCPSGFACATVAVDPEEVKQCVPGRERNLTCVDRCASVTCADDDVCDPVTGECKRPLRLCETGCLADVTCGAGPDDICLSIPNTPDAERMCATGCDPDPESEDTDCPPNYYCAPLDPENEPNRGVCFPLRGTCVDRCVDTTCPTDENCDQITGECEPSLYGACEKGCTSNAQCAGPDDVCLALGIGEGGHCWLKCDGANPCPDGYDCVGLIGSSLRICLPQLGTGTGSERSCQRCYDDDACYPGGVCNPVDGTCNPVEQPCTTNDDCPAGSICDPTTAVCAEIGRACSGDSFAIDCDNIETKCTTQTAGTSGRCAQTCVDSADCYAGTCRSTNLGDLCLGDDHGGAETCGTLYASGTEVGQPCSAGTCPSSANICVTDGNISGFCSTTCTSDADCDAGQACGTGPGGQQICIPGQCECARSPDLPTVVSVGLADAIDAIDVSVCGELTFEDRRLRDLSDVTELPLNDDSITSRLAYPFGTLGRRAELASSVDSASNDPQAAVETAASLRGIDVSGTAGSYTYPGTSSKLTQAVAALITASGGTPDLTSLDVEAQAVPDDLEDVVAPIISAVADAYTARDNALTAAGWDATRRQEAFDGAPYLFLPGSTTQTAAAPDLTNAATRAAYEGFPLVDLASSSADLAATIRTQLATVTDTSSWTGFSYVVSTPAGLVVLGDVTDSTYDPSTNIYLDEPVAVLIDVGGDDTYRVPLGANTSVSNGVSVAIDLGGTDTYGYVESPDPNDTDLLTSDADGRFAPSLPLNQGHGPYSFSDTARQGSGRVGIGMLIDYGSEPDSYTSLRMSQGSAVFGVGLLFDAGGVGDTFEAEALAQGSALAGLGVLWNAAGTDGYEIWHAGQGFGAAGGAGLLHDRGGDDSYVAVTGEPSGSAVVYYSPADRGASNRNLAQGAAAGMAGALGGGFGFIHDTSGTDTYDAGTYAQGYATHRGLALFSDGGTSNEVFEARGVSQGVGEQGGGAIFVDAGGSDSYNVNSLRRQLGQGVGRTLGWGILVDTDGDNTLHYFPPGGGVGLDGGLGAAFFGGGEDSHNATSNVGWGSASNQTMAPSPLVGVTTIGIFVDAGGSTDIYNRPTPGGVSNDATWLQPDTTPLAEERGVGVDR